MLISDPTSKYSPDPMTIDPRENLQDDLQNPSKQKHLMAENPISKSISSNISSLPTDISGLTTAEAKRRYLDGLGNNVPIKSSRSYLQILQENLFTFINVVFFSISLVLLWLSRYGDAFLVIVVILGGVIVSVCQEIWAKQKLDEIALLTRPRASVIRDGVEQNIDPAHIVVGDILVIRSGDQIVVDGQMVGEGLIEVDESLLTGESDLIMKQAGMELYSGSFCVSGTACYEAQKVGKESLAYNLTTSARAFRQVYTPLQIEVNLMIRVFLLLSCFLWLLVSMNFLLRVNNFPDTVQYAAVIAGLVPSGLYLAVTLAYALGAVRMIGEEVLIQQANAVESLSNVDVLCLDKTGTLTANKIHLQEVMPMNITLKELKRLLGNYAQTVTTPNQTSMAIQEKLGGEVRSPLIEIPFSSGRKWSGLIWQEHNQLTAYFLGAPDILGKTAMINDEYQQVIEDFTNQGLRVLLFTSSQDQDWLNQLINQDNINFSQIDLPADLQGIGILTFYDELRPEAQKTLSGFADAGITIKIISGDHPQTVLALAQQAGLGDDLRVIAGQELAGMSAGQLTQVVNEYSIFGRVTPEQKALLIKSLREQGRYVAMVGDGVNDVLCLKEANLAIAMESGSKATRGVADIVLLSNSFASLPKAFVEGQRIRNGIQDVLKLFMIRVFCVTAVIFGTGFVGNTFPLLNKQSAIVTLLPVGFPSFWMPVWAKAGLLPRRSMVRSLLYFTLPATMTLSTVALSVYVAYTLVALASMMPDSGIIEMTSDDFLSMPRSALVTIMIFCGLMLIPYLKPPARFWVAAEPLSGDWRYTILSLILFGVYVLILAIAPVREFFELALLERRDYLLLGLLAIMWSLLLRYMWRAKLLDRFLGVDLS